MENKKGSLMVLTAGLICLAATFCLGVWREIKARSTSAPTSIPTLEKRARGREVKDSTNCVEIVEVRAYEGEKGLLGQFYENDLLLEDGRRVTQTSFSIKKPGEHYCEFSVVPVSGATSPGTPSPDASVPNTPLFDASVPNTQVFE